MEQIIKYPRTFHIEGSKEQPGDSDLDVVPFEELKGAYLVIEEKMDGANCGISFNDNGDLILQSRGHVLAGGERERHFALFKAWAHNYSQQLWDILSDRFIMYGEWMYAKHTIFYDALPHYFLEFDIFDKQESYFLSTRTRIDVLKNYPFIHSVRILKEGYCDSLSDITSLVGESYAITQQNRQNLSDQANKAGIDVQRVIRETDLSGIMEGLYIKAEDETSVTGRYKYIRGKFLQAVLEADGHWLNKPIIPNLLKGNKTSIY